MILLNIIGAYLPAQAQNQHYKLSPNPKDSLLKYVINKNDYEKSQGNNHKDSLLYYEVTLTGIVVADPKVDHKKYQQNGQPDKYYDCDSTFNIYIKDNDSSIHILHLVERQFPWIPPCMDTVQIHVEVICTDHDYCAFCEGYPSNKRIKQYPKTGDIVAVTGDIIIDISNCEFEIHPAWKVDIIGKSTPPYPKQKEFNRCNGGNWDSFKKCNQP